MLNLLSQNSPARAVICPHAGYRYSGPTAAHSFRQIDPRFVYPELRPLRHDWYKPQGGEDHLCPGSFSPCQTFWVCCYPACCLPNSPLWSQVKSFPGISPFWFPMIAASTLKSVESSSTLVTSRSWPWKPTKTSTASKCSSPILQRWLLFPYCPSLWSLLA